MCYSQGMSTPSHSQNSNGYAVLLGDLKERIRSARLRAALAVNQELVLLYWSIGRDILARQVDEGWGARVIDRLSADLRHDFPEMTGLSARNGVGARRQVRPAQFLTHTVQQRTETGLASRIMWLSTWTASATSPL